MIVFDSASKSFLLNGKNYSYAMYVNEAGYLQHLYYRVNSIVYNESEVISAGHTDDSAFAVSPEHGWGWIADIGAGFMQTDWLFDAKAFFARRK